MMEDVPYLSKAIGIVIEKFILESGMSRAAVADFAEMERRYLYKLINAKSNASVRTVYKICDALGIEPLEFFAEVEDTRCQLEEEAARLGR